MSALISLLQSLILCGTLISLTLLILLAIPQSQLRKVLRQLAPWCVAGLRGLLTTLDRRAAHPQPPGPPRTIRQED